MLKKLIALSLDYPKTVIMITLVITLLFMIQFPKITIDTDPENMLEETQSDRIFYDRMKKDFGINDMIVLGITNDPNIYTLSFLDKLDRIINQILRIKGVIIEDVISFSTSNNVTFENGFLKVNKIMKNVPNSKAEADIIRKNIDDNPLFLEKIVSKNGKSVAIYIPIEKKSMSYRISKEIEKIVQAELDEDQKYYIAGLPVAEDTFGYEMFREMGITAPIIGFVIFVLMFFLFRKVILIIPSMVVMMFSVIWAMGLLIGLGFTVHIMSSMIPVFLMPIAVLDSVHILSEFYDRYPQFRNKRGTLIAVTDELFTPMFYTSITSSVGFSSLALAAIPPVRIFGLFVAFGIMSAWILTIIFIPAWIMLLNEEKLSKRLCEKSDKVSLFAKKLQSLGVFAFEKSGRIIVVGVLLLLIGIFGLTQIQVNDNPVKWFKKDHPIRIADDVMNTQFGGTYMAYIVAEGNQEDIIKQPEVISYFDNLQKYLENDKLVGKTTSVADIVKRINYTLHGGDTKYSVVPKTAEEIAQYLFLFLSSGDPNDLDNFVDYDYKNANIWIQMKSGDNKDMENVENLSKDYINNNPPPPGINFSWSGLTYINKVWQDLMVKGMLKAIMGGFAVVFVLMVILFRSFWLGLISMLPLSFAIILSYGIIGFIGKDYDMPIAVCSSLSLGLAVDFAIHFIQRFKQKFQKEQDLRNSNMYVFGLPARAISRNALVIIIGFLPLMLSGLTPYVTVGTFFASLMIFSTISTLIFMPAVLSFFGKYIFKTEEVKNVI